MLETSFSTGGIPENAAHGLGGGREKMASTVPFAIAAMQFINVAVLNRRLDWIRDKIVTPWRAGGGLVLDHEDDTKE